MADLGEDFFCAKCGRKQRFMKRCTACQQVFYWYDIDSFTPSPVVEEIHCDLLENQRTVKTSLNILTIFLTGVSDVDYIMHKDCMFMERKGTHITKIKSFSSPQDCNYVVHFIPFYFI